MKDFVELKHMEIKRIYHYADSTKFEIENVTHFLNSNSTHRLKTKDNRLWIVEKKFIAIEIHTEDFTV